MSDADEARAAAARGDWAALAAAHARGANVLGDSDPEEMTTLHVASSCGHVDAVLWLLRVGRADAHCARANHFLPLHSAAMNGHADVVRLLLAGGADPNVQTRPQGYAPLHSAAWAGHVETVRVLVVAGADTTLLNYRNETPAETARRQGHEQVAALLGAPTVMRRVSRITWGQLELDGGPTFKDAKLWPGGAREWNWGETGTHHVPGIQKADVDELLDRGCDVIVLSRGQHLKLQVSPRLVASLESAGVEVFALESRAAVTKYNELVAAGRRAGALIHSTC